MTPRRWTPHPGPHLAGVRPRTPKPAPPPAPRPSVKPCRRAARPDYFAWLDHVRPPPAAPARSGSPARSPPSTRPPDGSCPPCAPPTMPDGRDLQAVRQPPRLRLPVLRPAPTSATPTSSSAPGWSAAKASPTTVATTRPCSPPSPPRRSAPSTPARHAAHLQPAQLRLPPDRATPAATPPCARTAADLVLLRPPRRDRPAARHAAVPGLLRPRRTRSCGTSRAGELWRRTTIAIEPPPPPHRQRARRASTPKSTSGVSLRQGRRDATPRRRPLPRHHPPRRHRPRRPGRDRPATRRHSDAADLVDAVDHAAAHTSRSPPTPHPDPARRAGAIAWGDAARHPARSRVAADGEVTDAMVAALPGQVRHQIHRGHRPRLRAGSPHDTIDLYADPDGSHTERLIDACWSLGGHTPVCDWRRAYGAAWAHMLGFGGHFLTKARRYSITFRSCARPARHYWRRTESADLRRRSTTDDETPPSSSPTSPTPAPAGTPPATPSSPTPPPRSPASDSATAREELAHEHGLDPIDTMPHRRLNTRRRSTRIMNHPRPAEHRSGTRRRRSPSCSASACPRPRC